MVMGLFNTITRLRIVSNGERFTAEVGKQHLVEQGWGRLTNERWWEEHNRWGWRRMDCEGRQDSHKFTS